jgi:hypothetical protein
MVTGKRDGMQRGAGGGLGVGVAAWQNGPVEKAEGVVPA